jgi:hypothetical protein
MKEVYGSDCTSFSDGGFVYAAEADFRVEAPQAVMSGVVHQGTLTYGQLPDNTSGGLSVSTLIKTAHSQSRPHAFHLRSAVVNNDIVFQSHVRQDELHEGPFVNEIIHYAVLEKTAVSIEGNQLSKFSLTATIRGNSVFWTDPTDPIAKSLFMNDTSKVENDPTPNLLKGVN